MSSDLIYKYYKQHLNTFVYKFKDDDMPSYYLDTKLTIYTLHPILKKSDFVNDTIKFYLTDKSRHFIYEKLFNKIFLIDKNKFDLFQIYNIKNKNIFPKLIIKIIANYFFKDTIKIKYTITIPINKTKYNNTLVYIPHVYDNINHDYEYFINCINYEPFKKNK
jgi:hypothetical protein